MQLWSVYLISSYCNRPIFVFLYVSLHYYEWRYHIIHVCNVSFSFWLWMLSYYWHVKVSVVLYDEAGLFVCVCVCVVCMPSMICHTCLFVCMYVLFFYYTFICHVSRLQMLEVMDINSVNIITNKHMYTPAVIVSAVYIGTHVCECTCMQ